MENRIIEFKNVSRKYGDKENLQYAVKDVSFTIDKGEFVVILGQSGAGKSTVLNILGGIDRNQEGRVLVDGVDISTMSEDQLSAYRADKIGFVFQFYNLLTGLTALENVLISKDITKKKINGEEMLRAVGLGDKINKFPGQMSGGEQQRVSIARALAKNPKIMVGDEPTGALDSETGKDVLSLMYKICKDNNRTLIIVTHNSEIAKAADKVISMRNAEISSIEINDNPISLEQVVW